MDHVLLLPSDESAPDLAFLMIIKHRKRLMAKSKARIRYAVNSVAAPPIIKAMVTQCLISAHCVAEYLTLKSPFLKSSPEAL